ncbi:MAG TPA: SigE family RNA polymerase sigma factor [Mycobacteriales bacterium]|nr:SigE family RNA polymerase sigma factor [Mycobacteriales bacterium]
MTGTLVLYEAGPVPVLRRREEELDADQALTALYTAHYRKLVRIAALLLDDIGVSEEVVQDAYVKMHGAWNRIRDPQAAEAYLRTTVANLARSRMRRRLVAQKHAPKPMPDAPSAEHGAMESLERDRVVAALGTLPARQRECLVLRYYADMSEAQIAETMRISPGAVKSHASRGMAALRARLEERP